MDIFQTNQVRNAKKKSLQQVPTNINIIPEQKEQKFRVETKMGFKDLMFFWGKLEKQT